MRTKIMITTLLAASLMLSCNPKEILEPSIDYPAFVVIDGDTVKTRDDKEKVLKRKLNAPIVEGETTILPNGKKLTKQNLIKRNEEILKAGIEDPDLNSKPLRVVASGSGGGYTNYNNESIEFSLPNLIANQMGVEFNNPYFDINDYNGAWTYSESKDNFTGGPVPKFKTAKNNLGVQSIDKDGEPILTKIKKNIRVDNFVDPTGYGNGYNQGGDLPMSVHFKRFETNLKYEQRVLQEKFDFLIDISYNDDRIIEKGFDGYTPRKVEFVMPGGIPNQLPNEKLDFFSDVAKRKNIKGIIISGSVTSPSPYTNIVSVDMVRKELNKYQKGYLLDQSAKRILPNSKIDSLLGTKVNMNIKPFIKNDEKITNYLNWEITQNMKVYDKPIKSKLATQMLWPELDLNYIYVQIYLGKYISHDGVKIDYKDLFENVLGGNSKLRNIIIANEALLAINAHYGTTFPLYNTREFLK
ncbi:hypothetical protein [Lacihabitans soyangensis]|uniref:Uncharacterized protein n=1 Tax=Lacihabitans soyangensis TaxID=869394 RepID=A0AAE3KRS9_9BACT|nr:hypothetical protein [Lacihabitans soyangensis]MCP9762532.1 hypothetical protein [Lacihabitans soyangensis]